MKEGESVLLDTTREKGENQKESPTTPSFIGDGIL